MKKLISVVLAFALITCGVVYYTNENNAYAVSASSNEKQLLARAVNGEARGEPYEGQVAVAAVILNRVRHSSFPNTISGVIYQPGAFTVYKACNDALNGWDPSGGAIYYFNPDTATNAWIWSRPLIKTIGKHRFCK